MSSPTWRLCDSRLRPATLFDVGVFEQRNCRIAYVYAIHGIVEPQMWEPLNKIRHNTTYIRHSHEMSNFTMCDERDHMHHWSVSEYHVVCTATVITENRYGRSHDHVGVSFVPHVRNNTKPKLATEGEWWNAELIYIHSVVHIKLYI